MNIEKVENSKKKLKDRYIEALKLEKYRNMERNIYHLTSALKGEIVRTLTTVTKGYSNENVYIDEETGVFHVDKEHSYLENESILKEKYPDIYNYSVELKKACKDLKDNLVKRKETIIEVLENYHITLKNQLANELKIDVKEINDYGSVKDKKLLKTVELNNLSVKIYNTRMTLQECKNRKSEDFAPKYKNGKFCENEEIRTIVTNTLGNLFDDMNSSYKILEKTVGKKESDQFCIDMADEMNGDKKTLAVWLSLNSNVFNRAPVSTSKEKKEKEIKQKSKKTYKKIELGNLKHILLVILSIIFFPITIICYLLKKFSKLNYESKENIGGSLIVLIISLVILTVIVLLNKFNLIDNASDWLIDFGEKCANDFFDQESWGIAVGNFFLKPTKNNLFLLIILVLPTLVAVLLAIIARVICSVFVILFVLITIVLWFLTNLLVDLTPILVAIGAIIFYLTRSKNLSSTLITLLNIILCACSIIMLI